MKIRKIKMSINSSMCQSHSSQCFPQPWTAGTWSHPHGTGTPWMWRAQPEPQPASWSGTGLWFRNILLSKSILSANQFQQLTLKTPPTFCKNSDLRCSPQRLMRVWIYASRASNGLIFLLYHYNLPIHEGCSHTCRKGLISQLMKIAFRKIK